MYQCMPPHLKPPKKKGLRQRTKSTRSQQPAVTPGPRHGSKSPISMAMFNMKL